MNLGTTQKHIPPTRELIVIVSQFKTRNQFVDLNFRRKAALLSFVRRSLSMAATKHALIWPRHRVPEFM